MQYPDPARDTDASRQDASLSAFEAGGSGTGAASAFARMASQRERRALQKPAEPQPGGRAHERTTHREG